MFPTTTQIAISNRLLAEVASSGVCPDPTLFVYGVLGALCTACLLVGYLTVGRTCRRPSHFEG